jgi:hypothetical protein
VLGLHLASAQAAVQKPAKDVGAVDSGALPGGAASASGFADAVGRFKVSEADQWLMDDLVGPDPLVALVPLQLGLVALGDILDVEKDLLFALQTWRPV